MDSSQPSDHYVVLVTIIDIIWEARAWCIVSIVTGNGCCIRSSIMSHITFKMCQFVLQIYLRDYQYDFDLDMLCYGLVMVYFNLLILHIKIYVRLITFSDDFSCLRIYISDYPGIFLYFLHVQDSIMIRFPMSVSYCFKFS